ncbi:MAG: acyl-CoA dehydrogenase C-terminal domain-containing protein, partial [Moraxellaceae bacterium]|nr:acyl-CoA dehydrogenase C-terminal domain-containing protein [Moraxellaceae bacterium]
AMYTAKYLDLAKFAEGEVARAAADRVALLTPVVKAYLSDKGFEACVDAQQVFGGHGFIREWGMEQLVRDVRIAQIYEGANGIQALDLMGRKVVKNNAAFVATYVAEMRAAAAQLKTPETARLKAGFVAAIDRLEALTQRVIELAAGNPDEISAASVDYLHVFGLTSYAYMWALMAAVAEGKAASDAFYADKLALADYFAVRVLPEIEGRAQMVEAGAAPLMRFAEQAF